MKILFVENHKQFVTVVTKRFLQGHAVTAVSNMAKAWQKLTSGGFDVVLVDYDLDDGKGDQLVKKIRANYPPIKVVAVSSHTDGNTALQEAGADAVCSKLEFQRIQEVLSALGEA